MKKYFPSTKTAILMMLVTSTFSTNALSVAPTSGGGDVIRFTQNAEFRGAYSGGIPDGVVGDTLLKQFANTSIYPAFQGGVEPLRIDAIPAFGDNFRQAIKILVKFDSVADKKASVMLRPTGLNTLPDIVGRESASENARAAFSGITAHVTASTLEVNFFGTIDSDMRPSQGASGEHNWRFSFPAGMSSSAASTPYLHQWIDRKSIAVDSDATAVLISAYIVPSTSTSNHAGSGYIALQFNQATLDGVKTIVVGKSLTDMPLLFEINKYSMDQWQTLPIIASSSHIAHTDGRNAVAWNIPAAMPPISEYFRDNSSVAYMEYLATRPSGRERRGITSDDLAYCLSTIGMWCVERLFGAPSIDNTAQSQQIHPVIITQPQPRPSPDLDLYHFEEVSPPRRQSHMNDVDLAMNMLHCGQEDASNATSPQVCTVDDTLAIQTFSELSLNEMVNLRQALHDYSDEQERVGAGQPPIVSTSSTAVNTWAVQNPTEAENILDSLILVANASDAKEQPASRGKVRNRKKAIVASCVMGRSEEIADAGWECVKKAKAKTSDSGARTGVPPVVQRGGEFYLRDRANQSGNYLNTLVNEVRNTGLIPAGFNSDTFGASVYAIARDGAPAGTNRNIVYLTDAALATGTGHNAQRRFGFGINHILSPGPTGSQQEGGISRDRDIGHREHWSALGVSNDTAGRTTLARIVMTALTGSTQPHTISSRENFSGTSYSRTYGSVTLRNGEYSDTYTDITIVVGSNGNVITAFPKTRGNTVVSRHTRTHTSLR